MVTLVTTPPAIVAMAVAPAPGDPGGGENRDLGDHRVA